MEGGRSRVAASSHTCFNNAPAGYQRQRESKSTWKYQHTDPVKRKSGHVNVLLEGTEWDATGLPVLGVRDDWNLEFSPVE